MRRDAWSSDDSYISEKTLNMRRQTTTTKWKCARVPLTSLMMMGTFI